MIGHCCTQPLSRPPCPCIPQGFTKRIAQSLSGLLGEHLIPTAKPGKRPTCQFLGPGCLSWQAFISNQMEMLQVCWRLDPRDAQPGWRHTACPSMPPCHGSLWMREGILHPVVSKLESSMEVRMGSPPRRSQRADGCRAAGCRTALHAIQSREQSPEGTLPKDSTEPVTGVPVPGSPPQSGCSLSFGNGGSSSPD